MDQKKTSVPLLRGDRGLHHDMTSVVAALEQATQIAACQIRLAHET